MERLCFSTDKASVSSIVLLVQLFGSAELNSGSSVNFAIIDYIWGVEETYLYCWNWIGMTGGAPKSDIVSARKRRKARVEKEREDVLVPVQGSSRL